MQFLYTLHSHNRWFVVALAVIAIVKLTMTWLGNKEFSPIDRVAQLAYMIVVTLQFLIGLTLLFMLDGGFTRHRLEHAFTNIIAVGLVHFAMRWKREPGPIRARNTMFAILASLALIYLAVMRLPQGWKM